MAIKIPYLQYELLELINDDRSAHEIALITGYPLGSKTIENAKNALKRKGLLYENGSISTLALEYINKHYPDRHSFKDYKESDLTLIPSGELFNDNIHSFNRWYKYLEDFPNHFIKDICERYKVSDKYYILDPFVGSGTTLINSKKLSYKSIGFDVNPVMVFISKTKTKWNYDIKSIKKDYQSLIRWFIDNHSKSEYLNNTALSNMPKTELNQWLSPVKQVEAGALLWYINNNITEDNRDFFSLALVNSTIKSSYVAYCPGTTFYPFRKKDDLITEFRKNISEMIDDLESISNIDNKVETKTYNTSSLNSDSFKEITNKVDLIITSPPYPNDLEYTRQTRLEMYMLGYVTSMSDVKGIKQKMVKGSTKLIYSNDQIRKEVLNNKLIQTVSDGIYAKTKDKNWGFDYPKMVQMYFSNMYTCLENYHKVLINGGTAVLVIGDQTIQGVLIKVGPILKDLALEIGFTKGEIELHRQRRSTNHSLEIPEENLILIK